MSLASVLGRHANTARRRDSKADVDISPEGGAICLCLVLSCFVLSSVVSHLFVSCFVFFCDLISCVFFAKTKTRVKHEQQLAKLTQLHRDKEVYPYLVFLLLSSAILLFLFPSLFDLPLFPCLSKRLQAFKRMQLRPCRKRIFNSRS